MQTQTYVWNPKGLARTAQGQQRLSDGELSGSICKMHGTAAFTSQCYKTPSHVRGFSTQNGIKTKFMNSLRNTNLTNLMLFFLSGTFLLGGKRWSKGDSEERGRIEHGEERQSFKRKTKDTDAAQRHRRRRRRHQITEMYIDQRTAKVRREWQCHLR